MPEGVSGREGPHDAGSITDAVHLETLLSEPSQQVVETLARLEGDIIVLGVGGKMGPTLARMARRAADMAGGPPRRVIGVSRFTDTAHEAALHGHEVETITCDLLD